jgi:hypothetical protein
MTDFNISNISDTWKTMWEGALPGSQARELTRQSARTHWDGQQRILDSLEDFANGWFDRRGAGVRAATEAAQEMCGAPSLAQIFGAWQRWAAGATERLAADGMAWQQCLAVCGQHLTPSVPREIEESKAHAKTPKSTGRELPKAA